MLVLDILSLLRTNAIACHDSVFFTKFPSIPLNININIKITHFLSRFPIFICFIHSSIHSDSNSFSFSFLFLFPPFTWIHLRFVIHNNQFRGSEIKFHLRSLACCVTATKDLNKNSGNVCQCFIVESKQMQFVNVNEQNWRCEKGS